MIKRLMERGEFGTIYSIQMRYIQSWGMSDLKPMQWRFDEKRAGSGTLGDTGSMRSILAAICWAMCAAYAP